VRACQRLGVTACGAPEVGQDLCGGWACHARVYSTRRSARRSA
jgi:hypothetical protein